MPKDKMPPPHCGCAITESTYGDCGHKQKEFIKCARAKAREEAQKEANAQTITQRNRSYTTPTTSSRNLSKASHFFNNITHTMRNNFNLGVNPNHVESPPPKYIKPCDAPEIGFIGSRSGICDMCKREKARREAEKEKQKKERKEKMRYDVQNEMMENEESEILFGGYGRARPRAFTDVPRVAAQNNNQNNRNRGLASQNSIPPPPRVPSSHPPPTIGLVSRNANVNNRKRTNPVIQNQNHNQVGTVSGFLPQQQQQQQSRGTSTIASSKTFLEIKAEGSEAAWKYGWLQKNSSQDSVDDPGLVFAVEALGTGVDLTMPIEPPMVYRSNSARKQSVSPPLHRGPSRRRELSRSPSRSSPRTPPSKPLPKPSTRPSKFTEHLDSSREHFNFGTTDSDENNVSPISPLASEFQTVHPYPDSVPEVFRVNRERRRAEREREEREERERGEMARRGMGFR